MLRHQIQDGGAHMDTLMCTFQSLYSLLDELIDEVELGACYSFSLIPFREFHGSQNSAQLDLVFEVFLHEFITSFSVFELPFTDIDKIINVFLVIQKTDIFAC